MKKYYQQFVTFLDQENKDEALRYALSLLEEEKMSIEQLYATILTPSLTEFSCLLEDKQICIWREHVRTSIVRTILESTYPYIIKRKQKSAKNTKKIMVFCPSQEFHEIGAIIVTHLLSLHGFNAQYVGANTPKEDVINAIRALKPDYVAISVTNYYNLIVTNRMVKDIREFAPLVKIIVGGQAFLHQGALDSVIHDYYLSSQDDIIHFAEEVNV
ncbi:MAG: cobalamin B12-binding domain-containing protein [Bacilli bacterium]